MLIRGSHVLLRPLRDEDWLKIEEWGRSREALWGPFQRFQLDHLPMLRDVYKQTGLLKRDSGFLIIETTEDHKTVGFVRYTLLRFPDADIAYPEIGVGVPEKTDRGKGYAREATELLVDYLFSGYPTERIAAFTDTENAPAQRILEKLGFMKEGVLRRSMFRDGRWTDIAVYAVLRNKWKSNSRKLTDPS